MNIDEYVCAVDAALPPQADRIALDDLREFLIERAAEVGEATACAELGSPADYAAELEAAYNDVDPTDPQLPPAGKFLGIPYNFRVDEQWWRRIFNPADERILVPHAFGWGWGVNLGAVAVRLGDINPDDIAEDTIALLSPAHAKRALWLGAGVATAGLAGAILGHKSGAFPTHWGWNGTPDSWGTWTQAVTLPAAIGAGATALSALPTLLRHSVLSRLNAQAAGVVVLAIADGVALLAVVGADGQPYGWLVLPIVALGAFGATAPVLLSFRDAVREAAGVA